VQKLRSAAYTFLQKSVIFTCIHLSLVFNGICAFHAKCSFLVNFVINLVILRRSGWFRVGFCVCSHNFLVYVGDLWCMRECCGYSFGCCWAIVLCVGL